MSRPSEVYVRSLSPQEATSYINTPARYLGQQMAPDPATDGSA
jgi:hypothetical protein